MKGKYYVVKLWKKLNIWPNQSSIGCIAEHTYFHFEEKGSDDSKEVSGVK